MSTTFIETVRQRRSNYTLSSTIPISDEALESLLREVAERSPSPFNMQNPRLVLLLGEHHHRLWAIVKEKLREKSQDEDKFRKTETKIDGFAAGYGSILFFNQPEVVKQVQQKFPLYAEHFSQWSEHANGAMLYGVWLALAAHGIAASIQHYNPLIDKAVQTAFNVPDNWVLVGQMPFGEPTSFPGERKTVKDMLKVFK